MQTVELKVDLRSDSGKGVSRRLRREGRVPGVFYGPSRPATMVTVEAREFAQKISKLGGTHLIRFVSDSPDVGSRVVLIKDTQYHPVHGGALHVDFYEVNLERKIQVRVPLHFTGKAAGVALGGILQPVRRDIDVLCLPTDIPEHVNVDVSPLGIHESIHISQLEMPQGVEALYDSDFAIVTVLAPYVEEAKGGAGAAGEPGAETAKAEGEKKSA